VKRDCCAIAYLRGVFLGGGFVADPHGDFHFEMTVETEQLAEDLVSLMARFDIDARVAERRGAYAVYLKGAEPIVTFLALVGAHRALLRTEDVRIVKSMRNDVNRLVNAEIANQQKTADAALAQIEAIRAVAGTNGLDSLPPALRDFAELRLAHPDVSLRELGELADPPLTKSAVYHRVRRIQELASEFGEASRRGDASKRGVGGISKSGS
jgi:DNA-binding protein WhiA